MQTLFTHRPHLPNFLFKIVWIIPGVMAPIGLLIYFTEGGNLAQLVAIIGFAFGLSLLLFLLIKGTDKYIAKRCGMQITDDGIFNIRVHNEDQKIHLGMIQSIQIAGVIGAFEIKLLQKDGQEVKHPYPGNITKKEKAQLRDVLHSFGIELK